MEKTTITIGAEPETSLRVYIDESVIRRFVNVATDKEGLWRSKKTTFGDALESALEIALLRFIDTVAINPDK
jgi:hypothetical protein